MECGLIISPGRGTLYTHYYTMLIMISSKPCGDPHLIPASSPSKVELVLEMVSPGAAAVGYSVIICYLLLK